MDPPKAMWPFTELVLMVTGAVFFNVVGTLPATVNELALMLVTAVLIIRLPLPEPIMRAARGTVSPTL